MNKEQTLYEKLENACPSKKLHDEFWKSCKSKGEHCYNCVYEECPNNSINKGGEL